MYNYVIFRPRTTSLRCQRSTTLPQCHSSCFSHGSWTHFLTLSCYCIINTFPPPLLTSEINWLTLAAKQQQMFLWIRSKFGTCKISVSFFWRAALPASASRRVPAVKKYIILFCSGSACLPSAGLSLRLSLTIYCSRGGPRIAAGKGRYLSFPN